ncbi:type I-E CRISPR-associated protein Cas6/Cse3/CasE [Brevibacterium sp. LS14]|uniref:type I-E CRISPR-associated protein Cas6/Cse3/CasE n=1 Tax=Brevibacterium TaxID=1696 RepID=UPI0011A54C1C|nr:type I-E CRISPR-associated protein Cas6/Cse3/CasE [Brevibacterium casei]MCT2360021.1 type I-E CRISPR-associated protein Cas6/Cse3/CasE [Brevibacterium casei]NJE67331.1 type I-E CRISPR-associated protein Cas6/Cse3/CasE [Brevibacterium sp. LS14]NNV08129.1 type I-E CRISPR-associated protein Cas6/Cse3/CasE [Geobacillus sp. MMMUD3]
MFLSRCELNAARRGAKHLLASPQKMHAAVEASFPSSSVGPEKSTSRKLWRIDEGSPNPLLYIVSESPPDFTHIEEQAGWPTQPSWAVADYSPLLDGLEADQIWEFRLTANPVHSVRRSEHERGKRFAHVTVAQQEGWLAKRAGKLGVAFDVGVAQPGSDDMTADEDYPVSFRVGERRLMKFRKKDNSVTIRKARFDGVLRVTDPQLLRSALINGIGSAKAYGCGLLTLAPVGDLGGVQLPSRAETS